MDQSLVRYYAAVDFIESLSNIASSQSYMQGGAPNPDMYLDRTRWLAEQVGNPQNSLRLIHVAGTAGKGTVSTLIYGMLQASGKKTGLFTSPFATTTLEKIRTGDRYIESDVFADIVDELKPILTNALEYSPYGLPSYYEIFVVLALLAFQRTQCEWAVIEVGCGGTYDATNIIPAPEVAVITTIDYDHMHLLGNTLPEIASNKAGIIKQGSVVWTSEARPELRDQFQRVCAERGAEYHEIDPAIEFYQDRNKAVAKAVAHHLGIPVNAQEQALETFRLPCRFETVQEHPRIILDGAHNPAKVRAAAAQLRRMHYERLHVVIGMAEDKDAESMLEDIIPLADACYYTRFLETHRAALPPQAVREKAQKEGDIFLDPHAALEAAQHQATDSDIILVIGSFYLSGELRKRWYPEDSIVTTGQSF